MPFSAILSRDRALHVLPRAMEDTDGFVSTRVSGRLLLLVRERPVTTVIIDSGVFAQEWEPEFLVRELARRFPSVGTVFLARRETSPYALLRLGRVGREVGSRIAVLKMAEIRHGLPLTLARVAEHATRSLVLRAIGARLPSRERRVVGDALEGALIGWGAEDLAARAGWTRPHLSERLRAVGLPSAGKLLLWARTLHASRWLVEEGRTAESVSRQLGYANGATFRRALRTCLGLTPTRLVEAGGLSLALRRFLDVCGLDDSLWNRRSVA